MPGHLFKFRLKGGALIGRRALYRVGGGRGGCLLTKSVAIGQKLKEQITHTKELCKHMEVEITGSDLTEKKLFFCTDSAVIEAYKVRNKVEI